ncbi:MAG: hypothetical protein HQK51_03210 [Oligoflexia bacterium]|nr:hypothetical protein [Oligoflexia bacterium]
MMFIISLFLLTFLYYFVSYFKQYGAFTITNSIKLPPLKRYLFIWNAGIILFLLCSYIFFLPSSLLTIITINNWSSILVGMYGLAWFSLLSFIIVALVINEGRSFKNKGLLIRIPILGALIGYSIYHFGNNLYFFKPAYIFVIQFAVLSIILFALYFNRIKWRLAYRNAFTSWTLALLAFIFILLANGEIIEIKKINSFIWPALIAIFFSNLFLFQMINFFMITNYMSDLENQEGIK